MANHDVLVNLDLHNQQLMNTSLQNLSQHPATANRLPGWLYWNTVDKTAYIYTGLLGDLMWLDLGQVYKHPLFTTGQMPSAGLTGAKVISSITLDNGHITAIQTRDLTADDIDAAKKIHTHKYTDIVEVPANSFLGNKKAVAGVAEAITVSEMLSILGIAYGTLAQLEEGLDTKQRTFTAADINKFVKDLIGNLGKPSNLSLGIIDKFVVPILNSNGAGVTIPSATNTKAGVMTADQVTKLEGIAEGANKYTHPTFTVANDFASELTAGLKVLSKVTVNAEGHTLELKSRSLTAADLAVVMINDAISNGTLTTWSSSKIRAELDAIIAGAGTGALIYKGDYNPVTNQPPITTDPLVKVGYTYVVSANGVFFGEEVEIGDMIIVKKNNPGDNSNNYQIVNKNIPAIVDATTLVKGLVRLATIEETRQGGRDDIAVTPIGLYTVLSEKITRKLFTIGDGSSITFDLVHNLEDSLVDIDVRRVSNGSRVFTGIESLNVNSTRISVNVPPATGEYVVIITLLK